MRDPKRISRILSLVRALWEQNPDLRLIQLLMNNVEEGGEAYHFEDDKLEEALRNALRVAPYYRQ
jgi:uncharacterized protein YihD (DUF1040 family)